MKKDRMLIGYDYELEAYCKKQKEDKETARKNLTSYVENFWQSGVIDYQRALNTTKCFFWPP